jgi:DNA-binding FrmR family transcriptional regulator
VEDRVRTQVLKRLNYITGHVAGIKRMAETDRYCVDLIRQSYAVRKSLEKLEAIMLEGHLRTCVVEGIHDNQAQIIDELIDLYTHANR